MAPGNPYLGVILPYAPLHHLLMRELGFPVVATSGNLTDEQKTVARRCRDGMRSVYAELCVRLLQSEIMLEQGMVPDISTYRSVFCPEGGDAPWMLDRAG